MIDDILGGLPLDARVLVATVLVVLIVRSVGDVMSSTRKWWKADIKWACVLASAYCMTALGAIPLIIMSVGGGACGSS
ncbi:hypothetical protein MYOV003v1_p0001 [Vibrio phage 207E48.1]|nr:hypothetical protein MYOV003v1_p0001 [Vibrio phage 207E48.1]